jgi:hypothetical protein
MQPMCFSARARLMVLLAVLLVGIFAFASEGHDFAAKYDIRNAVEQGDSVHFTMHLTVKNQSNADVKNAVVALGQAPGVVFVGKTEPIKLLKEGGNAAISQQFTISQKEYQRWLHGGAPTMFLLYRVKNTELQRPIAMAPQ